MKRHLRKEKDCLNCGAEVTDRFCPHCGQENVAVKETFAELVTDFFADVTHYDSKFFYTIKDLLFKPGFLTRQYFEGRRTAYLNPLRMYFFISFIFFFISFLKKPEEPFSTEGYNEQYIGAFKHQLADSLRNSVQQNSKAHGDTLTAGIVNRLAAAIDTVGKKTDTTENINLAFGNNGLQVTLAENKYSSLQDYDSVQASLPESKRDKGLMGWILRRNIALKTEYGNRTQSVIAENFNHSIPKLMFFLLPLFAWFIYVLYSRKKFYYAQHAIFSVHFHCFVFLLLLVVNVLGWLPYVQKAVDILMLMAYIIAFIYLVAALKNAYRQSITASVLKAITVTVLYIISLVIGIVCLVIISFITA